MNLASLRAVVRFTVLFLPALLPLAGCGRAEYEAEVDKAIARLKIDNQFKTLDPMPTVLAAFRNEQSPTGTKVTFRKPAIYTTQPFNAASKSPRNEADPMKPERLKPPFLQNFPGYFQTWEKWPITGRNDSIVMLYTGAQVAEPGLTERLLAELKAALPDLPAELAWGTIDVPTPEGKSVRWNILTFDHEQDFWHLSDSEAVKIKGTFLLLVRDEQGRQVCLGCRWSDTAGDMHQRRQEVLAAAGTVQVALGAKID
jgi:hypothetical protein